MDYAVVEVIEGVVSQVSVFADYKNAESLAKRLCRENEIPFYGNHSYIGNTKFSSPYSIQIVVI